MSRNATIHPQAGASLLVYPLRLAAQSFMLSREAMDCTPSTLVWYRQYINALITFLEGRNIKELSEITPDLLRRYLVDLKTRKLAPTTIHHHASAARSFFNFLCDDGLLVENPMRRVAMPRLPKEIKPAFTPEDVHRLLDGCQNARDRALVLCLLDSGARASEFCALTVGDVDLANGAVSIRQGKGRKDRVAFLGRKAGQALTRYLLERGPREPDSPLWLSIKGNALTTCGLRQMLERLAKRSGVAHCHPHTFRRTCALWSLRAGMSIYHLQSMLGHSDLSVLRRYLALVEGDLKEAHRKHGAVDSLL